MNTIDKNNMQARKITDRVYWVGAIDWGLRDFHGYLTSEGSTYNAFLITGDHPVLIDTVKPAFKDEMMARISSIIDPGQIKTIISNHSELDHSGALPAVIAEIEPEEIIASQMGVKALNDHFHWDVSVRAVADGERIALGNAHYKFIETRMLHWPDSLFTFLEDDNILFSNDAFGCHLASSKLFSDELPEEMIYHETAKYYANIILPYSPLVTKLIDKLPALDLNLKMIAPDHGPVWRNKPEEIISNYARWAHQRYYPKAVIVYDTMWDSTKIMAESIAAGISQTDIDVAIMPLKTSHRSDIITELLEAGALIVGSPTLNGLILPTIADATTYIKGLKPKNLIGMAFGSYGWAPQSIKQLEQFLSDIDVEITSSSIKAKYVPDQDILELCRQTGFQTAEHLQSLCLNQNKEPDLFAAK